MRARTSRTGRETMSRAVGEVYIIRETYDSYDSYGSWNNGLGVVRLVRVVK